MTKNDLTKLIHVGIDRSQCQDGQKCGQSLGLLKAISFVTFEDTCMVHSNCMDMLLEYSQRLVACKFIFGDDLKSHDLLKDAMRLRCYSSHKSYLNLYV